MTTISGLDLLRITYELNEFYLLPNKDKETRALFRKWLRFEERNLTLSTSDIYATPNRCRPTLATLATLSPQLAVVPSAWLQSPPGLTFHN